MENSHHLEHSRRSSTPLVPLNIADAHHPLPCLPCEPMVYSCLSTISPTCVYDKLCQYFSFLSMFMDLFCIVVKYLQCSFLSFSHFCLFICKFIIMFSVTCSTESVMLSCFNKILYLILNLEKTCLFLNCCVRRVLGWEM